MSIIYIQMHARNCRIEALVNDIVVLRKNERNIVTMARPIHEYLTSGVNNLEITVLPFGKTFPTDSNVHLRVAAFNEGDFLEFDGGINLAEIVFPDKHTEVQQDRIIKKVNFQISCPKNWLWTKLPKLALNERLKTQLNQFIFSTHKYFTEKNADKLMLLQGSYYEELEECYPTGSVKLRENEFKQYIIKPRDSWNVNPVNFEHINYKLSANGRLIECLDFNNLPLIRTVVDDINSPNSTDGYVAFPMHVGLLDNNFKVFR